MKYLTKQWHSALRKSDQAEGFERIPDDDYTSEKIKEILDQYLEDQLTEAEEDYNTEPTIFTVEDVEEMIQAGATLEDFVFVNEETEEMIYPESFEQLKEQVKLDNERLHKDFINREPFDYFGNKADLISIYENAKEYIAYSLPDYVKEEVPVELLAMYKLPASTYDKFYQEQEENTAIVNAGFDAVRNVDTSAVQGMIEYIEIHDDKIEIEGEEIKVTYTGVTVLESDLDYYEDVYIEYSEKYGHEVHFLIEGDEDYYLTFTYDTASIEEKENEEYNF